MAVPATRILCIVRISSGLAVHHDRGGLQVERASDGRGRLMLRMHVGDNGSSPLAPEPGHHHLRGLAGVPPTLMSGRHDPRDLGDEITRLLGHGGLHCADCAPVVESAHDPVEPPLRTSREWPTTWPRYRCWSSCRLRGSPPMKTCSSGLLSSGAISSACSTRSGSSCTCRPSRLGASGQSRRFAMRRHKVAAVVKTSLRPSLPSALPHGTARSRSCDLAVFRRPSMTCRRRTTALVTGSAQRAMGLRSSPATRRVRPRQLRTTRVGRGWTRERSRGALHSRPGTP